MIRLAETLAEPEANGEAREGIRSLIGEVVITQVGSEVKEGRQVTLFEFETLVALKRDHNIDLGPEAHRRDGTYSLCNDPADNKRYLVAVKRERDGRGGSLKLHDEVKVGDTIGVSLPRGGLDLDREVTHFAFVAGGIGVTPHYSMCSTSRLVAILPRRSKPVSKAPHSDRNGGMRD